MKLPFANKDLGQHFLVNDKVIQDITHDFVGTAESIIEVGPGPAVLTQHLAKHNLPLHVIEMDERFQEYLCEHIQKNQISFTDAMEFDFSKAISSKGFHKTWLVSNLPYNVGSPLMVKFAKVEEIKMMTLMMQKEVGDRIFPPQASKNFAGSLFSLMQTYFEVKKLCNVSPGSFQPPPKVDSIVLSFSRKEAPDIPLSEFSQYETFLRRMFAQKRKQMAKVLSAHYPRELIINCLEELGVPTTARSESLNLQHVQHLYKRIVTGAKD